MAVSILVFDHIVEEVTLPNPTIDLANDSLAVTLHDNGLTVDTTDTIFSDVSGSELADGNGYTAGGQTIANQSFTRSGGILTLDGDDIQWDASGGDIGPAYYGVIRDTTVTDEPLVAIVDFDGAQTAGDGTPFKLTWDASGILQIGTAGALGV
jgi:hypothetical protein